MKSYANKSNPKTISNWINTRRAYLYLLPGLFFVFSIVGYGIISALIESVNGSFATSSWTTEHYRRLFSNAVFWESFWFSMRVTFIATIGSLGIGVLLTRILYQYFLKDVWKMVVWIPMLVPHFVAAYMILLLFSPSGWFSSLAFQVGIIADSTEFPILVNDRQGMGLFLAYLWKQVPFVVLMLLPVYYQLDKKYVEVVRTLGGGSRHVFFAVEWQRLYPVLIEVGIILFAFILAAFEIPFLLGTTYPKMISVLTYQWFYEGSWANRPLALAAMTSITFMIVSVAFISLYALQRTRFRMMRGL